MDIAALNERRTTADVVFEHLYNQIISLEVMPGSKMSETDVANQFNVSRQPVRDAFRRLGNMQLLRVQPQKTTIVQKFSLSGIRSARVVRLGVELEILRLAVKNWTPECHTDFAENLAQQDTTVKHNDTEAFHALDGAFHELIAMVAGQTEAFEVAHEKKLLVDRMCVLSLKRADEMTVLAQDHRQIFEAMASGDQTAAQQLFRTHLGRIESTIDSVHQSYPEYFED